MNKERDYDLSKRRDYIKAILTIISDYETSDLKVIKDGIDDIILAREKVLDR